MISPVNAFDISWNVRRSIVSRLPLIFAALILAFISPYNHMLFAEEKVHTISFALVGDIMLGTDYPDSQKNIPAFEGADLFRYSRDIISAADIAVGNLEGSITSSDSCRKALKDSVIIAFRMPPNLAWCLADAGFDVLTTANNHANDFGKEGLRETESILDSLGIASTGRLGNVAVRQIAGTSIAVVGFSPNPGNHPLLDIDRATDIISRLSEQHTIVVVTFHGGGEGVDFLHLSEGPEMFLDLDRGDLRRFARAAVESGADIVFGHGPHIPRALELYNGRIIAYSLGNFCTWFGINVREERGLAPLLWVEVDRDGVLRGMKIISYEQQSLHYPRRDPERNAEKLMIRLSQEDIGSFPFEFLTTE